MPCGILAGFERVPCPPSPSDSSGHAIPSPPFRHLWGCIRLQIQGATLQRPIFSTLTLALPRTLSGGRVLELLLPCKAANLCKPVVFPNLC